MAKSHNRKKNEAKDPLGKLVARYPPSIAGVLLVAGVVALVGLGLIGLALLRESTSLVLLAVGGFILLVALLFAGANLLNVGRRLELRKRGVRFIESGEETEIAWEDVADIAVHRTDDTYLGVVSVTKTSSNHLASSGPLTQTAWDVTIHAHDGSKIHLRPAFLKVVPDIKKLITEMRLASGLKGKP
jgi:hypothetical protein